MHAVVRHRLVYTFFGVCFLLCICYSQGKEDVYMRDVHVRTCVHVCARERKMNRYAIMGVCERGDCRMTVTMVEGLVCCVCTISIASL